MSSRTQNQGAVIQLQSNPNRLVYALLWVSALLVLTALCGTVKAEGLQMSSKLTGLNSIKSQKPVKHSNRIERDLKAGKAEQSMAYFLATRPIPESPVSPQISKSVPSVAMGKAIKKTEAQNKGLSLVAGGVSYPVSDSLNVQYVGSSNMRADEPAWQGVRFIQKSNSNKKWFFAVDQVASGKKGQVSAGVGVLLPLK